MTRDAPPLRGGCAAVIVAAGRGERAGRAGGPKQFRELAGRAVLARSLDVFARHPGVRSVVLVIHPDDRDLLDQTCAPLPDGVSAVSGGPTRQASVRLGLHALRESNPDAVLIHDGVRPFVDGALIDRVIADIGAAQAALPAIPVADTLKREAIDGTVSETVARAGLHAAQTPQGFPFRAILAVHDKAHAEGRSDFTDDAGLAEWAGLPVRLVAGSPDNIKITWPRDLELARMRLTQNSSPFPDVRTGNGYDVHAFTQGDRVTLCGAEIPFGRALAGHSDADVGLHALTDALLATCGAGDIGTHFPPSDPAWKGAASRRFVEYAAGLVRAAGGRIAHADVTIIAEAPKIGPHRGAMTERMAVMLGIDAARVSVKATTNERLGFVGREEGIAAIATATVVYPGSLPE